MAPKPKPKIYSYVRFSSINQKNGDSKRRQQQQIDEYAKAKGLEIDESLRLEDLGLSAYTGDHAKHGALGKFLELCNKGMITKGSYLFIEQVDRISRLSWEDGYNLIKMILKAGVTIYSSFDEKEYKENLNFDAAMALIQSLNSAHEFSKKLSKRRKEAYKEARRNGKIISSNIPSWLKIKEDRSGFELIKEKADIVKKIVGMALDGFGDLQICKQLNKNKLESISGFHHWTNSFVSKILSSPALIGEYHPKEMIDGKAVPIKNEVKKNYFPPIIDSKTWTRLRALRTNRRSQRGRKGKEVANLFSGIMFNAKDRQPLQRIIKNHPRLVSSSFRNGLANGDTISIPYEPIEQAILCFLRNKLNLKDLYTVAPIEDTKVENLENEMFEIDAKLKQIQDVINKNNGMSFGSVLEVMVALEKRKKDIEKEIQNEQANQPDKSFDSANLDDLKALIKVIQKNNTDTESIRTRLKSKIRNLIKDIYVVVLGKKKSKHKQAIIQIIFRSGGEKIYSVSMYKDSSLICLEMDQLSGSQKIDLRLYTDPTKGKHVRNRIHYLENGFFESIKNHNKTAKG